MQTKQELYRLRVGEFRFVYEIMHDEIIWIVSFSIGNQLQHFEFRNKFKVFFATQEGKIKPREINK